MKILRLGETWHDRNFVVDRPSGHPHYLFLLLNTPGRFWVEGKWQEVSAETVLIFKPGQKHLYGYTATDNKTDQYSDCWIHIVAEQPLFLDEHFPFGKPVAIHHAAEYHELFRLLSKEYFGTASNKDKIMNHLLQALLYKVENEVDTRHYPELYYQLLDLRAEFYSRPSLDWSIGKMAQSLSVSEGYLYSAYKKYFGTTCMADVIQARIEYSCEYLQSTNNTVEEIAELCGYNNTEHFIRQFKKKMNCTPLQYKKQYEAAEQ